MPAALPVVISALQAEALDHLVWRGVGAPAGSVEAVLDAGGPELAQQPALLPEGALVTLPPAAQTAAPAAQVQLWD